MKFKYFNNFEKHPDNPYHFLFLIWQRKFILPNYELDNWDKHLLHFENILVKFWNYSFPHKEKDKLEMIPAKRIWLDRYIEEIGYQVYNSVFNVENKINPKKADAIAMKYMNDVLGKMQ